MPIELACPSCRKTLQVPDHAAGKKARCPACGEVIPVPAREPVVNPYTAPTTAPESPAGSAEPGELQPGGPLDVGKVWQHSFECWKRQLGVLVGATAVIWGVSIALSFVLQFVQLMVSAAMGVAPGQPQQAAESLQLVISVVAIGGNVIGFLVQSFLQIGMIRISLDVSRGLPTNINKLFSGGDVFGPYVGFAILFSIAVVVGMCLCIIPGIWMSLIWWPGYYLIVEKRARVTESFGVAQRITRGNVMNCLVVFLLVFGVNLVGLLACCVGLLFSTPLSAVITATAYRFLAGDVQPSGTQQSTAMPDPMAPEDDSPFA